MASRVGSDRDAGAAEALGDRLSVDVVPGGYVGEREPSSVEGGGLVEGVVSPGGLLVVARDLVAVEVGGDGGPMEPVPVGEFVDRCGGAVGGDEVVDVVGQRRRWMGFESRPQRSTGRCRNDNVLMKN
jgi:hypothetical protein